MEQLHGGDVETARALIGTEKILDFSANINPFGVPESVQKAIVEALPELVHYPDPYQRKLRRSLGEFHAIVPEQIVCGNGGADVLFRFVRAVMPKRAILPVPTFSEYEKALREVGCAVTLWQMPAPFALTEALFEELSQGDYDFLVLCNPNNPTGTCIAPELLRQILDKAEQMHIWVLLDACFYEMTTLTDEADAMVQLTKRYPHLFVLKSMTKLYAMPAIRLGYGVCADTELVERVRKIGQPWPVSTLAEAAGCAALADKTYRMRFFSFLQIERQYLFQELQKLGFLVWEPQANYVFFRVDDGIDLSQLLQKNHILIRHCASYEGLTKEYYRVAVRTRAENEYLLQCLRLAIQ